MIVFLGENPNPKRISRYICHRSNPCLVSHSFRLSANHPWLWLWNQSTSFVVRTYSRKLVLFRIVQYVQILFNSNLIQDFNSFVCLGSYSIVGSILEQESGIVIYSLPSLRNVLLNFIFSHLDFIENRHLIVLLRMYRFCHFINSFDFTPFQRVCDCKRENCTSISSHFNQLKIVNFRLLLICDVGCVNKFLLCPPQVYNELVPILAHFCIFLLNRLSEHWNISYCESLLHSIVFFRVVESNLVFLRIANTNVSLPPISTLSTQNVHSLQHEVLEEILLRKVTKDSVDFIKRFLFGSTSCLSHFLRHTTREIKVCN